MVLTRGELIACLRTEASSVARAELADPFDWADLVGVPETAAESIRDRMATGRTPASVEVFPWPKDREGFRPMAWMDPLDRTVYRALVGRLVLPLRATVDRTVVLSNRVVGRPPE